MTRKPLLILIAIAVVFILATCASLGDPTKACPSPTTDTKLLVNEEHGYCLLYPAEFSVNYPPDTCPTYAMTAADCQSINLIGPDNSSIAWIAVEYAEGRSADQVADAKIAALGPDFNIQRTDLTIDGEPAVLMDGLPGQDVVRNVVVVHNELLYSLSFTPWGTNDTTLVNMYNTIVNSLHFLPAHLKPFSTQTLLPAGFQFTFEYPVNGQVLDFEGAYLFKVTDIVGTQGYQWAFSQNGIVVWDNLRDNFGLDGGGTYAILEGSPAHAKFVPGEVKVSVRALMVGGYNSDTTTITIILQPTHITPAAP